MTALRIAFVNESYTAGATRCALDLVNGMKQLGHDVHYYPDSSAPTRESLMRDLGAFRPDVVHLHSFYGDYPYELLADVSQRYASCFTPHDPRPIGSMDVACWECNFANTCFECPLVSPRRRQTIVLNSFYWQRRQKRSTHARCGGGLHLAFPSAWLQRRFQDTELGRFASSTIPLGIDTERFRCVPGAKNRLDWPSDQPVILHVAHSPEFGAANPRKGLVYLAKAFVQQVLPEFPKARLVVVGDGQVPNHPRIQGAGSASQEELILYYSAADIFVSATLADNLPYTVLEAMACGRPVVASRVGGIPEEVEDGVSGILVEKENVQQLGIAINRLLRDPAGSAMMGRAGRERIVQFFGMDRFLSRYEGLYRQLAGAFPAPAH